MSYQSARECGSLWRGVLRLTISEILVKTVDQFSSAASILGSWPVAQSVKCCMARWPASYRDGWIIERTPESMADGRHILAPLIAGRTGQSLGHPRNVIGGLARRGREDQTSALSKEEGTHRMAEHVPCRREFQAPENIHVILEILVCCMP